MKSSDRDEKGSNFFSIILSECCTVTIIITLEEQQAKHDEAGQHQQLQSQYRGFQERQNVRFDVTLL